MIEGLGVRLPQPDIRGQEQFSEMAEHIGIGGREMFDMGAVGVGEGVERQVFCRSREMPGDTGHFAGEDRIPPLKELGVRDADAERGAQAREELGVADLAGLMAQIDVVTRAKIVPRVRAGSQPAWPAQHASVLLKSISSTTRPRSNSSASADPGASRGSVIAAVYEKRGRRATATRCRAQPTTGAGWLFFNQRR